MTIAEIMREYLRDVVKERFGNLNKLAKSADLRQASLHDLLNDQKKMPNPTSETIEKISKAFGCGDSVEFLQMAREHVQKKRCTSLIRE